MPENSNSHAVGETSPWWADAVIYQIYPRSFADGNGDGMGDLRGVRERLPYLEGLGVDAIWLSPFYLSPQADAGYDVADYRQVDPLFGSLDDFDAMLEQAHQHGIKVIVDLVPNHTSDEHAWFQEALASEPGSAARERYMFRDGTGHSGELPPNNWQSIFGGDAWTRITEADGQPGQWYLHLFDTKQPDLNWENAEVHEEFEAVLRFWLDRGVDGFRVDVAHGMVKAPGLPNWSRKSSMVEGSDTPDGAAPAHDTAHGQAHDHGHEPNPDAKADADEENPLEHAANIPPYFDQDGVHDIYREWNRVLAEYDGDRMMVAEAWVEPAERLARYIRSDEMQQAFNFDFLLAGWSAPAMAKAIDDSLRASASVGAPTTWVLSNHDTVRHTTRFGLEDPTTFPKGLCAEDDQPDEELGLARGRAASLLMLALPGSAYLYQGDELGLPEHTTLPAEVRQDPAFFRTQGEERGRDGCRVPLPWKADAAGYGFGDYAASGAVPWLPQPESFARYAADGQVGLAGSTFEMYRAALALRSEHGLGRGRLEWQEINQPKTGLLAFRNGPVLVVANMGTEPAVLPDGYDVALSSRPDAVAGGTLAINASVWLLPTK